MTALFNAAALAAVFCVGPIVIIMTAMAASQRGRTLKKLSGAGCILGAFVLLASCSTIGTSGGTSAKQDSVKRFVNWLQSENKKFLFLTNSSERSPKELQEKLKWLGVDVAKDLFLPARWQRPIFSPHSCRTAAPASSANPV